MKDSGRKDLQKHLYCVFLWKMVASFLQKLKIRLKKKHVFFKSFYLPDVHLPLTSNVEAE